MPDAITFEKAGLIMWFVTHASVGASIGKKIRKPLWLVVAIAVLSHFVLDFIPHWDYPVTRQNIIYPVLDIIGGVILLAFLIPKRRYRIAAVLGGIFAILPDFDGVLLNFGLLKNYYFPSHAVPFLHNKSGALWGISVQIVIILAAVIVIMRDKDKQKSIDYLKS